MGSEELDKHNSIKKYFINPWGKFSCYSSRRDLSLSKDSF